MANVPFVDPTKLSEPRPTELVGENPNPDGCKKHGHYPTVRTRRYSAGSGLMEGCPCMENRRDCDCEWGTGGRGFCRNCHHASSVTVKETDCRLDF